MDRTCGLDSTRPCAIRSVTAKLVSMHVIVERLPDLTSDHIGDLVTESEGAGLRMVRRLVDEWETGANRFDRPGEGLFGAWLDGQLVGVCGLNIDPYAGNEHTGRVRHLYVLAAFRRRGIGRRLVLQIMEAAPAGDSAIFVCVRMTPPPRGSTRPSASASFLTPVTARTRRSPSHHARVRSGPGSLPRRTADAPAATEL